MASTVSTPVFDEDDITELCFPACDKHLVPKESRNFSTLEEGVSFYVDYAAACGFQTRKSTIIRSKDGTILTRYVLCSREGLKENDSITSVDKNGLENQKRRRVSTRVDCMARIVFSFEAGVGYKVTTFNEGHTHPMVPETFRHLMKSNRKVDHVHQMFIIAGIKSNIGPMRTFRFYKELIGSYDAVGCTSIDFKNYARDLRVFVDGVDAHILLDNFKCIQENCNGFRYFYDVDEAKKLKRLFWADNMSIQNYQLFGDAVSLDATYSTNRYKMIFTPFTGRDNHCRCITFGAAIISNEDVDAYSWVLHKFVECMGSHPNVLITDQDPALKKAVQIVLPDTSHRFCLWHITTKVADKLPVSLREDSEFKAKLDTLVWSDRDEIVEFEEKWLQLMDEYVLNDHRWFSDMFECRAFWIPAYFRDIKMSGVFRTTSLSESENSFFRRYLNKNADLVRLYMHYVSAMDAQRSAYNTLTLADETGVPDMRTELHIERHAASVYTTKIFYDVQVEIVSAVVKCVVSRMYSEGGENIYDVDDDIDGIFKVSHKLAEEHILCKCKLFTRKDILCRHIFFVMRNLKMKKIPEKYILKRWSKISRSSSFADAQSGTTGLMDKMVGGNNHFFLELCKSIGYVNGNVDLRERLYSDLKALTEKFEKLGQPSGDTSLKNSVFQQFYGSAIPDKVDVLPPDVAITKGSGCGGRKKSNKEKTIELARKPKRNCKKCNRMVHHNSRNCPGKDVPV